jgi:hypothetical protein
MKIFTVLSAVIFATFVVAGPIKESNTEHGNQVEERQVWKYMPELIYCEFTKTS